MKFARHIVLLIVALSAYAESWPGWNFPGQITNEAEIPTKNATVYFIKILSDDPLKDELRIVFDNDTRRIIEVNWMTKGTYRLQMPTEGVSIPEKPSDNATPIVTLSAKNLKEVDYSKIGLVNFIWKKGSEQDAAANP